MTRCKAFVWFGVLALLCPCTLAAVVLRVATIGDLISMDPQVGDSAQFAFSANLYDALITRDKQMNLVPGLATEWSMESPTVWRFKLRQGVKFHDGTPFTADDVVFSIQRANSPTSEIRNDAIKQARKVNEWTVDIDTFEPYPILPNVLANVFMMSKKWCEENNASVPADRRTGVENRASHLVNGTGPFRLKERQPSLRTVLVRNANHWRRVEGNLDEVVLIPMPIDGARVAALLAGDIDLMEPAPLRDIDRLRSAGMTVLQGPELRTIFLGMDVKRDELPSSDVKGRNPFKDKRVRQAIYQAIDIETIRSQVMRNAATPAGILVGPGVRGFQPDMNTRLPYDPQQATSLLSEAGYPKGFKVDMNCSNDRYVNDASICQAVAAQLARVGVTINLQIEPKNLYLPKVLPGEPSFFLLGWASTNMDALHTINAVMGTPDGTLKGRANGGGYSNARIDELTREIRIEIDDKRRNELIREAFRIPQADIGHIPLHQQTLAWAFSNRVRLVQLPDNAMRFMWMSLAPNEKAH